ncbi:MAG: RNA recognition motif domain-containing protein [Chitinophagales bacterium]
MKRLYIGNLDSNVSEEDIREKFEEYGEVSDINLIIDRETGRSKGFGFIDMEDDNDADMAIEDLDGSDLNERPLIVNEARMPGGNSNRYGNRHY